HQALATGSVLGLVCAFVAAVVSGLVSRRGSSTTIEANSKTRNTVWALNGVAALTAVVHGLAFSSNSFTFREDSIVLYLAQTLAVALVLASVKSMRASATEQQRAGAVRALACAAAVLALNRVSSYSTVCREEQLPGCTPTFYGLPSASISSIPLAAANAAMAWLVPLVVRRFLRRSHSDRALLSKLWVSVGMRVSMGMAALYWVLDSVDGSLASGLAGGGSGASSAGGMETAAAGISAGSAAGSDWSDLRIVLARMAVGVALGGGLAAWFASPFCIDVAITGPGAAPGKPSEALPTSLQPQSSSTSHVKSTDNGNGSGSGSGSGSGNGHQTTAVILGYGNAHGAAYLVFVSVVFCVLYVFQQPMGGIMLSLLFVELVVCAELFDSLRDALGMADGTPLLPAQMALTAQLAYLGFFATGHQFTLVSIQWSTAFVGVREMQLLVCGAIVVVNTLGAFILCAASVPLAGLWNESLGSQALRLAPNSFFSRLSAAGALFAAYNLLVSASAAAFAAWFRRHLMVWKIFAPRFMFSAPTMLLSSALVLFVAVGFAAARILRAGLAIGSVQAVVARRLRGRV
ncbi:mannose-ethanolamine phosphotransferase gpi13, partial [Coemansia sp. RSA 486]